MYDFQTLSPNDFEILTRDLLQEQLCITLETFKTGKDSGIDLRYANGNNNAIIVQCKHYKNSTFSNLLSSIKKEIIKIKKLNPERYIIVTSLPLSPENKNKIFQISSPYILTINDIYGKEDLNNLLTKFPKIEKTHFKLWMTSTNILKTILHSDIVNTSTLKLEEIREKIKKFVSNPSVNKANSILKKENFVVISGAPGVGKTTLAEMLIWRYVIDGYEFINISENISEAFSLYSQESNKKQIFYYDDFLGETHLTKNEDSRLIMFINRINNSKNKKMILTTREYILQQTKLLYEKIDNFNFIKCVIDLKKYTKQIKAEILYSHLYFSELSQEYIDSILEKDNYLKIIEHPNYNPRIIEFMTKLKIHEYVSPVKYYEEFLNNLNNPKMIWNHVFENQINNKTRSILLSLVTFNSNYRCCDINEIKKISIKICESLYTENMTDLDFKRSLKILEGDFIKIKGDYMEFSNPSVRDFLEVYIYNNNLLGNFIKLCDKQEQFWWLNNTYMQISKIVEKYGEIMFKRLIEINKIHHDNTITSIMLSLIINSNKVNLIELLENEFKYIIKYDYRPFRNEDLLERLSHNIFGGYEIVNEFIKNIYNDIIENLFFIDEIDDYILIAKFINNFESYLDENDINYLKEEIDDKFDNLKKDAISDNEDDIDGLYEAKEKLEELNDMLNLFNDFDEIEDKIQELSDEESSENNDSHEEKYYSYKTSHNQSEQEDEQIKNLFDSLKS